MPDNCLLKDRLLQHGEWISTIRGNSMWPLLRPGFDIVHIVPAAPDRPLRAMDIVLYRSCGQEVLHRILQVRGNEYLILGDNCLVPEHIPCDQVYGVVDQLSRKQSRVSLQGVGYRLYLLFYVRPWRLRTFLFRYIRRLQAICKRFYHLKQAEHEEIPR